MSNRVATAVAASTSAPTSPETQVAFVGPGTLNPSTIPVIVNAQLALVGASSVTGVTVKIRRGNGITGSTLASMLVPVAGAVSEPSALGYVDTAYDGTGYSLTVTAAGAAATCGPGFIEAQPLQGSF